MRNMIRICFLVAFIFFAVDLKSFANNSLTIEKAIAIAVKEAHKWNFDLGKAYITITLNDLPRYYV